MRTKKKPQSIGICIPYTHITLTDIRAHNMLIPRPTPRRVQRGFCSPPSRSAADQKSRKSCKLGRRQLNNNLTLSSSSLVFSVLLNVTVTSGVLIRPMTLSNFGKVLHNVMTSLPTVASLPNLAKKNSN